MHTKLIAAALAFALANVSAAPAQARRSEVRAETVQTGAETADGLKIKWGRASTVIHSSKGELLGILHDYGKYADLFPQFRASRVLASRGDDALVYLEARVAYDTFTLWGNLRISSTERGGARVIDARLKRGNVSHFQAVWTVRELPGGEACEVEFKLLIDPDMKLPSSVVTKENVKAARRAVVALQRRVASR